MTNLSNKVLYTGVTNNIELRTLTHRSRMAEGFTKRYHTNKLVYFEEFDQISNAIAREKQIKSWSRTRKDELVMSTNPEWNDLTDGVF